MSNLYYIGFTARLTEAKGHGTVKLPLLVAQRFVDDLNNSESGKHYSHYLVAVEDDEQVEAQQAEGQ